MIILKAIKFARKAHEGQLRKYTNEPYIFHPINVGFILTTVTNDQDIISAGILHDVIEDTKIIGPDIFNSFGVRVTKFVLDVTDISKPSDGNRKVRKQIDLRHLAKAEPESKTIKLADIIDNVNSIIKYDPGFAKVWLQEKRDLLPYLKDGNSELYERAEWIINRDLNGNPL
jgi:(p)ppGpp synthase/HD superfamily hydrolase